MRDKFKFRPRAREVSRTEAFSDVVFGFALTLIVVSLEVPTTYNELVSIMRGVPAFAICFAILVWIWFEHHRFFRRYNMQDGLVIALNAALLFVVLFYTYPLKFIFAWNTGLISRETLQALLPLDDYDVDLCGPKPFMQANWRLLRSLGVAKDRIHYEFFGPASLLEEDQNTPAAPPVPLPR